MHLASKPETKGIISRQVLEKLAPGSYVINTSRAEVMDYDALAELVESRSLRVGLDVYPDEPPGSTGEFTDKIVKAGGVVYGTHHIGASTDQAQAAIAEETVRVIKEYRRSGTVLNCVNLCQKSPARYAIVIRHLNRPGVLARSLDAISRAGINVEEMENIICEGAEAACAQIKLDGPLSPEVLESVRTCCEHILGVSQSALDE